MHFKAEAIFAGGKSRIDFVPYEPVDYKGKFSLSFISCLNLNPGTVHGFTCRPNPMTESRQALSAACRRLRNGSEKPWHLDSVTMVHEVFLSPVHILILETPISQSN